MHVQMDKAQAFTTVFGHFIYKQTSLHQWITKGRGAHPSKRRFIVRHMAKPINSSCIGTTLILSKWNQTEAVYHKGCYSVSRQIWFHTLSGKPEKHFGLMARPAPFFQGYAAQWACQQLCALFRLDRRHVLPSLLFLVLLCCLKTFLSIFWTALHFLSSACTLTDVGAQVSSCIIWI